METDTRQPVQVFVDLLPEPSDAAAPVEVPVNGTAAARSEENISQWKSYLPADCVNTMIAMGWHITT